MQTKGFAMLRKIVLAALLATLFSVSTPAWATTGNFNSVNNLNKTEPRKVDADKAETTAPSAEEPSMAQEASESTPMQLASQGESSTLSSSGSGANDSLAGFGPSSGTMVGNRALELRDEVLRLRSSVNLNASEFMVLRANGAAGAVQYHSTVAAITARLQNGTTRGNPILLRQWEEAEGSLNEVTNSLNRLNALQTAVAADASLSSYMLESVQAGFLLSGAVDEDHDQLKLLRDEVSRLVVQLDYLRNQVADDIQRQTTYLTTERTNLQALAFAITRGELLGNSLGNRPVIVNPSPVMMLPQAASNPFGGGQASSYAPTPAAAPMMPVDSGKIGPSPMSPRAYMEEKGGPDFASSTSAMAPSTGRLLVLIRYNQPNVEYEQQLAGAVSAVVARKPDAEFSVIGVTPAKGEPSELATMQEAAARNAEGVKRSLVQLGLAPSRITVSGTQTQDAKTAEVHVYVR
ncbi:MAG: hypothetical protein WC612_00370 [Bdellovibrionales bacterium]|jgi:hypothetical protein